MDGKSGIKLNCLRDGKQQILTFEEAHEALWKCNIGWVLPTSWYRYRINGSSDKLYLYERLKRAELVVFYDLHRRWLTPITEDDFKITHGALIARVYRCRDCVFTGLEKDESPIEAVPKLDSSCTAIYGYQIKRSCSRLLVLGLEDYSDIPPEEIDWSAFEKPW